MMDSCFLSAEDGNFFNHLSLCEGENQRKEKDFNRDYVSCVCNPSPVTSECQLIETLACQNQRPESLRDSTLELSLVDQGSGFVLWLCCRTNTAQP